MPQNNEKLLPRQSEVSNFDDILFTDEAVTGRKVSMDEILRLQVLHGRIDLR